MPRLILFLALALALLGGSARGGEVTATAARGETPVPSHGSDADREAFLQEAKVVRTKFLASGITGSRRATLRQGDVEHDAHIQTIDEYKPQAKIGGTLEIDFRDSWRNNVAAYRLDRLLGLGMVPVTVARRDGTKSAAFTWWVDDVLMTEEERLTKDRAVPDVEAWNQQMRVVRVFDQLIYNADRNLGNLLVDKDWTLWMIDHTRAFKVFGKLPREKDLGERCARGLLASLRRLDKATLMQRMASLLSEGQVNALLARRDLIVRYYEARIGERGEGSVLYDLPTRGSPPPTPR
jgi:hypothetical protein